MLAYQFSQGTQGTQGTYGSPNPSLNGGCELYTKSKGRGSGCAEGADEN